MKNRGPGNQNKVLLYYCIGALVALLLFNWLVFPQMMRGAVSEVTYDQFLADLSAGSVVAVEEDSSAGTITYRMQDESGRERVCQTAIVNDPGLVDRVLAATAPDGGAVRGAAASGVRSAGGCLRAGRYRDLHGSRARTGTGIWAQ